MCYPKGTPVHTRNTYVPIDTVKRFDLVLLVSEKGVQVILPLCGCNAVAHIRLHIVLDIRKDDIDTSQGSFCDHLVSTQDNPTYLVDAPRRRIKFAPLS